jgi:hypothetical protein
LPEGLWKAAAEAAREHGVFRTGQVLHLEYGKLKRMMNSRRGKASSRTSFVELTPLATLGGDECAIELEVGGASFARGAAPMYQTGGCPQSWHWDCQHRSPGRLLASIPYLLFFAFRSL